MAPTRPGWSSLGRRARAWRVLHAGWSVVQLGCLAAVWISAVRRRRGRLTAASVALLLAEGGGLIVGRGDCPIGPLQESIGDPVPLFELILPPRAAKAAVPLLAAVSVAGLIALAMRPPPRELGGRQAHDVT